MKRVVECVESTVAEQRGVAAAAAAARTTADHTTAVRLDAAALVLMEALERDSTRRPAKEPFLAFLSSRTSTPACFLFPKPVREASRLFRASERPAVCNSPKDYLLAASYTTTIRVATHAVALSIFATRDGTHDHSTRVYLLLHGSLWCGIARGNTGTAYSSSSKQALHSDEKQKRGQLLAASSLPPLIPA